MQSCDYFTLHYITVHIQKGWAGNPPPTQGVPCRNTDAESSASRQTFEGSASQSTPEESGQQAVAQRNALQSCYMEVISPNFSFDLLC